VVFLRDFQDYLSLGLTSLAEFLRFSGLAETHRLMYPWLKCALLDESREFRQICRVAPHSDLDSANSSPLRSRFIYRLNRGREKPTLPDDRIRTR